MKRYVCVLLSAALLLGLLSGCRQGLAAGTQTSAELEGPAALEVVNAVFPRCGYGEGSGDVECLTAEGEGKEFLADYLDNAYGLRDPWKDAAVIRGLGASAFELAVLRMADEGAAVRAATSLMNYISQRQGDFTGYAPDQADMAANGSINQRGRYAALFICPDTEGAEAAFGAALGGAGLPPAGLPEGVETPAPDYETEPGNGMDPDHPERVKFVQPNKEDMSLYDTSAIRAAWELDDPSGLSGEERKIYDKAKHILGNVLRDGMSGLEKETAIYNWIVNNVDYDWTHQDRMKKTPRASFTPYGGLVNRTAVCLGYATTFQLLCDLAGVECITVVGAAFSSREDHGWNMVRPDGRWYCVDATWDANYREQGATAGRPKEWAFFNVTSQRMADTDHQWDYASTPEAVE